MSHFDRHFTLGEANALLPRIREIFQMIHSRLKEAQAGASPISLSPHPLTPGRTNGKQTPGRLSHEQIVREIGDWIAEIADNGIVIQDVSRGLIDFPAFVEGEEVFLCYELNDGDTIRYWHSLDRGYAGRRPIPSGML